MVPYIGWTFEVIGNVVAVVLERRREKGQQPQTGDAQVLKIIQLLDQAGKIADAVAVAVFERADVQFVDDRVLVPQRIAPRCPAALP